MYKYAQQIYTLWHTYSTLQSPSSTKAIKMLPLIAPLLHLPSFLSKDSAEACLPLLTPFHCYWPVASEVAHHKHGSVVTVYVGVGGSGKLQHSKASESLKKLAMTESF